MSVPRKFRLNFVGDVMLGRLIDQLMPTHVHEPSEASIIANFKKAHQELQNYSHKSPWGDTLPMFHDADINLVNLETAVTTFSRKWPDKVFNYRMHPGNIRALHFPPVDYAGLANNHTLDFCREGLVETVRTLKAAGIKFAGAGESREEATRPAVIEIPRGPGRDDSLPVHHIHVYAGSDHPDLWSSESGFHLIDYTSATKKRLKQLLTDEKAQPAPSIKIFSVHWGPNYCWHPDSDIRSMAHFLIDECEIDIIHGHSSHHVQGVEKYKGKLIIYGCGDFVDDYAVTPEYRNNLSAVWRVTVAEGSYQKKLSLKRLEIFPTKIELFQARLLDAQDADHQWVANKLRALSKELGTEMDKEPGDRGQVVLSLNT
jgi:poly-gamma-glutamate capsule biosynthesis protein CapA/YwtB (metallophosphatase superfamily)